MYLAGTSLICSQRSFSQPQMSMPSRLRMTSTAIVATIHPTTLTSRLRRDGSWKGRTGEGAEALASIGVSFGGEPGQTRIRPRAAGCAAITTAAAA